LSARIEATDAFSASIFNDIIPKDATFEGSVLWPFPGLWNSTTFEDCAAVGVLGSLMHTLLADCLGSLDSAGGGCLRAENVRILVGGTSDLASQWIVFEDALTLVHLLSVIVVVRFLVEHVAPDIVIVARLLRVVDDVMVWVAEYVGMVLSLL